MAGGGGGRGSLVVIRFLGFRVLCGPGSRCREVGPLSQKPSVLQVRKFCHIRLVRFGAESDEFSALGRQGDISAAGSGFAPVTSHGSHPNIGALIIISTILGWFLI